MPTDVDSTAISLDESLAYGCARTSAIQTGYVETVLSVASLDEASGQWGIQYSGIIACSCEVHEFVGDPATPTPPPAILPRLPTHTQF